MGSYLYCIVPPGTAPPDGCVGLEDAPVMARRVGDVACWISQMAGCPEATLERIRRHNGVVETALATGITPVPVRFGQWLPDPALDAALLERQAAHRDALQRVAGGVEFGVRVLDPASEHAPQEVVEPAGSGTAYMRALAAREQALRGLDARGREIASCMGAVLGSIVREQRVEALASRHGVVSVAHLVERAGIAGYRAAMERVRRDWPDLRFLITGPWPPYSFVA